MSIVGLEEVAPRAVAAADTVVARPPLKWVGGKRQLLPEIRKLVPAKFGAYYEPFFGGGAVFFDLCAAGRLTRSHLSDANGELVNLYMQVRDDVESLICELQAHTQLHSETHYYGVRAAIPLTASARAARTVYLNRTGFNGLYRVNQKGGFNVPFGRHTNPTICDEENLRACSAAFSGVDVSHANFACAVTSAARGDFVYFDPPYVPVNETSNFTGYTAGGFGLADQERLVECARKLTERGVHVLLSNADVPRVRSLYAGFEIRRVEARRNINSKAGGRGVVGEVLIFATGAGK